MKLDQEDMEELRDSIKVQLEIAGGIVDEQATYYRNFFLSLTKVGFTEEQAMQLVCASLRPSK